MDAVLTTSLLTTTSTSADISGAGDSVIVTIIRPNSCGYQQSAAVARQDAALNVTVTLSAQGVSLCDPISGSTQYRVAVHHVPSGTYAVSAHFRTEIATQIDDAIVGTQTILVP